MIDRDFERLEARAKLLVDAQGTISYLDLGHGKPLVLVHGGHGGWYHWMANVEAIAQTRRVIASDLPGFGASSTSKEMFSLELAGNRIFDLLDSLSVEQFDLVAFSFGCCIAGYMAAHRPERVRSLTLVNPAGMGPPSSTLRDVQDQASEAARSGSIDAGVEISLRKIMLSDSALVTPELTALTSYHVRATRVLTRPIARTNPTKALIAGVKAPVWLILGTKDPHQCHDLAARQQWIRDLSPDNEASVVSAAHWLQYERAQWFNEQINAFIDSGNRVSRGNADAQI